MPACSWSFSLRGGVGTHEMGSILNDLDGWQTELAEGSHRKILRR